MVSALLFAFGAMLCWGLGDFLIQRAARRVGSLEALLYISLIGGAILTPLIIEELSLLASPASLVILACLSVAIFSAGYLDFEALREGKLAVVDVIITFELPVTLILSVFAFGERPGALQLLLMLLVFAGIVLIAKQPGQRLRWEKGAMLAAVVAVLMGMVNFLTAGASMVVTPLMAIWLPWLLTALLCVAVLWRKGRLGGLVPRMREFPALILAMAVVDTAAWLLYAFAVRGGEVAILTAITESYPAVAAGLGVWINKERLGGHQWLGALLAIGASAALAASM